MPGLDLLDRILVVLGIEPRRVVKAAGAVGRRDAKTRAAHMLCEFAVRLETAGLGQKDGYEFPMTQEQLADALGLTSVHTNRVLMALGSKGLINRTKRTVRIDDWQRLAKAGDFNTAYLHLAGDVRRPEPR